MFGTNRPIPSPASNNLGPISPDLVSTAPITPFTPGTPDKKLFFQSLEEPLITPPKEPKDRTCFLTVTGPSGKIFKVSITPIAPISYATKAFPVTPPSRN